VQQQLDLNHEGAMKVADGVTTLANAVVHLQATTDRSSSALQGLLERTTERDAGIQKLHTSLQNWMLFVAILSCMTLFGGVILAWIALEGGRTAAPRPASQSAIAAPSVTGDPSAQPEATTVPPDQTATEPAHQDRDVLGGAAEAAVSLVEGQPEGAVPN